MEYIIRDWTPEDIGPIMALTRHYAQNSFSVYHEETPTESMDERLRRLAVAYIVLESDRNLIGFGHLRKFMEMDTFKHTGVISYYLQPEATGKGLGAVLLNELIRQGKQAGITNFLANISSKNEHSLRFHQKHGFEECGRFQMVGVKFSQYFDVVWMQKRLD